MADRIETAPRVARPWGLGVTLAACVGLRGWLIAHTASISNDGPIFIRMARGFAASPVAVARAYDYHVGYPAAVDAAHALLAGTLVAEGPRGWDVSAQLVSLVASAAAMVALWTLAAGAFDRRVALAGTLLFAVSRKWSILGADVMSDALALALALWAAVLAIRTLRQLRSGRRAIGLAAMTGLLGGLGYLVRPEALALVPLSAGLWSIAGWRERLGARRIVAAVAAAGLVAATCALPYAIAIGGLTKKKRLVDFAIGPSSANSLLATVDVHSIAIDGAGTIVVQTGEAMHWLLCGLAATWLVAWVGTRTSRGPRGPRGPTLPRPSSDFAFLVIGAAGLFVPVLLGLFARAGSIDYRHALLLAALLVPFAGAGAIVVADAVAAGRPRLQVAALALASAALLVHSARPLHAGKNVARHAGEQLAPHLAAGDVVFTNSWIFMHYADANGSWFDGDLLGGPAALQYVRHGTPAVTIFATTNRYLAENARTFAPLNTPDFERLLPESSAPDAIAAFRIRCAVVDDVRPGARGSRR